MKTKLVTNNLPKDFDEALNEELRNTSNVIDIKFSTCMTDHPDGQDGEWDTVYSAIILYKAE